MKIALVVVTLLAAAFGIWYYQTRNAAKTEEIARVLELDPRKVEPSTRALLLFEAIPHLEAAQRAAAVKQLRGALESIPRGLVLHRPSYQVEALRFSGDGRALLWYGRKTGGGIHIERWTEREPRVVSWSAAASNATFLDDAGKQTFTDQETDLQKGTAQSKIVMSRDGAYLALIEHGILGIWRVRDVTSGPTPAAFSAAIPNATTRLQCVPSADLCGLETPGKFTIIDVKKGKILRTIAADRTAAVDMSPSGRLAGVAGPRTALTIHSLRDGKQIGVDTAALALEDFAFSADEKSVVAVDRDGVLHSYDAATGKPRGTSAVLRGEPWKSPLRIDAAGDGRFVVWGGEKVRLVSADLATVTARFDEGGEVVMVKPNPQGNRLAIARRDGPLTLWDVGPAVTVPFLDADLLKSACDHIGRPLTAEEWARHLPSREYEPRCR